MVKLKSATHGLTLRSDACATDGSSATDAFLVLMATTSLPTAVGATPAMTAGLPSLGARVRRPSGPTARPVAAT